ncbi:GNAT family N-acetyltransferase [Marinihelvus fidelis]|uniref:GNAT family N-acetyltransferase n=1 Tax=Marinihelvus fidelis TaxID=2613842 RepID=A0A5N0T9E1_9GAMM|nr:GNAT family N-acetyltransferase [Marinihelvus fidelis]KAA9131391.1 GNAT family N-acetyltransferase [Marinihelvus fidelis]
MNTATASAPQGTAFHIRPMTPGDSSAVAAIIRSVMTEFGAVGTGFSIEDPEVDDMYSAYPAPAAGFWVVERDGRVAGCGGFAALVGGDADTCELRKMYFMPELRGLGAGHALMEIVLDAAASAGYRRIYLETLASMEAARALYTRHGFEPLDGPLGCTGHGACNAFMARPLG